MTAIAGPLKPRGEFIDIGGRRLRIVCAGPAEGSRPLVMMESGAFGFSADWGALQDKLAQRVIAEGISVRGLEEIVALGETGSGAETPAAVRRATPRAPGLADLAERLSDRLETRVKVDLGQRKGKITVEFASLDDLRRIVDIMDPRNRNDRPI